MGICIECRNHGYQYKSYTVCMYAKLHAPIYLDMCACIYRLWTVWTDEKAQVGRVREEQRRSKKIRSRITVFLQWFVAPEGRKVGSLKRRVRSHLASCKMKNCTTLWLQVKMYKAHHSRTAFGSWLVEKVNAVAARSKFGSQNVQSTPCLEHFWKLTCQKSARHCGGEAHFQVKMYKAHHAWSTFGSWDVEKVHAVVAGSSFPSQNVETTPCSEHFWKLTCRKSARRCGAKLISKSKCTKHTSPGPLSEVEMSKKCTPLWHEAHLQVKMYKTHYARSTFGSWLVEKCAPLRREAHVEVKMWKAHHVQPGHTTQQRQPQPQQQLLLLLLLQLLLQLPLQLQQVRYYRYNYTYYNYKKNNYSYNSSNNNNSRSSCFVFDGFYTTTTTTITTTLHYRNSTTLLYAALHYSYNYSYNYTTPD